MNDGMTVLQDGRIAGLQEVISAVTALVPFCNPAILPSCNH
jgi:hypothetical protein